MGCGKKEQQPTIPSYSRAEIPADLLSYIQSGVGKTLAEPSEYGISSQALQDLLGYTPEQFQYPMDEIQQALAAQQALQMEQYQKQLRPIMANQGQLDSTYYANMIGDYLKGQQAQTYGTTADLLTNQATQNYDLSKWLPTFRGGAAEALAGLGSNRTGIQQYNMEYPYKTYIPAYQSAYGQSMDEGANRYQSAMNQFNQDMANYNQKMAEKAAKAELISRFGGMPAGIWYGESSGVGSAPAMQGSMKNLELASGLMGAGGGGTGMGGGGGGEIDWTQLYSSQPPTSSQYKPQWNKYGNSSTYQKWY